MKVVLAVAGLFVFASCAVEQERKPVMPESSVSEMPWNRMMEGEGQGQFGAFEQR